MYFFLLKSMCFQTSIYINILLLWCACFLCFMHSRVQQQYSRLPDTNTLKYVTIQLTIDIFVIRGKQIIYIMLYIEYRHKKNRHFYANIWYLGAKRTYLCVHMYIKSLVGEKRCECESAKYTDVWDSRRVDFTWEHRKTLSDIK